MTSARLNRYLRYGGAILAGGIGAGAVAYLIFGVALLVQWAAYGQAHGPLIDLAVAMPLWRRLLVLPLVAGIAGAGWYLLSRRGPLDSLARACDEPRARFSVPRTLADSLLQISVIAGGASAGREGAPRQASAALANWAARALKIDWPVRRLILAAGSGAGLAVVYGTPWAAIPFALTVTIGQWNVQGVIASAAMAWIGTLLSLPLHHLHAAIAVPQLQTDAWLPVYGWALAAIPLCAVGALAMELLCRRAWIASAMDEMTLMMPLKMAGVAALTAAVSIPLPAILANGSGPLRALTGHAEAVMGLSACLIFIVAKPLLTALSFRVRMLGGLLMPSASTGAALGGAAALVVGINDPAQAIVFAVVGATGYLAVVQHSPLFAAVFVVELTHPPLWMWPALALVAAGAHVCARFLENLRKR